MKTLADLKRNARHYEWAMIGNSWFKDIPDFLRAFRQVSRVLTMKIAFVTNKNGELRESWTDFPKAKHLEIKPIDDNKFIVRFIGEVPEACTLSYLLQPVRA